MDDPAPPSQDEVYHRYYRKWYSADGNTESRTRAFYLKLLGPHLPEDRSAPILDVGCGVGFALRALRAVGYTNAIGVDTNREQVLATLAGGERAECVPSTAEWLEARAATFALIVATDVIEHVDPQGQIELVRAIFGALRPGGAFVCTVPNANAGIGGRWRYLDHTHRSSFSEHSLEFLLGVAGLSEIVVAEAEIFRLEREQIGVARRTAEGLLRRCLRGVRRMEMIAELGWEEGRSVPLSVNLLGTGRRK